VATRDASCLSGEGNRAEIWLLRHGRSLANDEGLIVSNPDVAKEHYGLTRRGASEVKSLLTAAKEQGLLQGAAVHSSPFLRATQTAAIAAEVLGATGFVADDRLRERWLGQMEMTPDANYQRVWQEDARDPDHTLWGVEAATAVLKRAVALVLQVASTGPGRGVLLVTHGDVASVLLCAAAQQDLRGHHVGHAMRTAELRSLDYRVQS
jgi:broad specificity phosphatase PhoE